MTEGDIRRFFEEPGGHVLLEPDGTVVDVGAEFLRLTWTHREDLVGKNIFATFPDNSHRHGPDSVQNVKESIERALTTGEPDKLPAMRYDLQRPDGDWEERWWIITNIPIYREDKLVLIHRVEDVSLEHINARKLRSTKRYMNALFLTVCALFGLLALSINGQIGQNRNAIHHADQAIKQATVAREGVKQNALQSCRIQARGLLAGHELVEVINGLHAILTLPPSPAQRRQQAELPKKQLQQTLAIVAELNVHLAKYSALQAKQPATRKC